MYNWFILLYTWNQHNFESHLYTNEIKNKKQNNHPWVESITKFKHQRSQHTVFWGVVSGTVGPHIPHFYREKKNKKKKTKIKTTLSHLRSRSVEIWDAHPLLLASLSAGGGAGIGKSQTPPSTQAECRSRLPVQSTRKLERAVQSIHQRMKWE